MMNNKETILERTREVARAFVAGHYKDESSLFDVFLSPVYYFLILFDFARHEYEADAFAVKAIKKPESYEPALIKLQVALNTNRSKAPRVFFKDFFQKLFPQMWINP